MRNRGGFTIIETLIVLGVTAVLFVAVIGSITDRQNRIQFSQGMRDISSLISDVMNDVTTGFYPTTPGLICTAGAGNAAPQLSYDAAAGDTTGLNKDCVFAGKVIQIGTDTSASSGYVYSMAGRRLTYSGSDSSDVANFLELKPIVIDSKNTDNVAIVADISNIDATSTLNLPYGIRIVRSDGSDGGRAVGVFYKDFRGVSLNGQSSSGVTGVAIADVASATGGALDMSQASVIAAADNSTALNSEFIDEEDNIVLCFFSNATNQAATITISSGISGNLQLDYEVDLSEVSCE